MKPGCNINLGNGTYNAWSSQVTSSWNNPSRSKPMSNWATIHTFFLTPLFAQGHFRTLRFLAAITAVTTRHVSCRGQVEAGHSEQKNAGTSWNLIIAGKSSIIIYIYIHISISIIYKILMSGEEKKLFCLEVISQPITLCRGRAKSPGSWCRGSGGPTFRPFEPEPAMAHPWEYWETLHLKTANWESGWLPSTLW